MGLSGAQSPFARSGRYPSRRDFQNLVGGHYPAFLAPTDSCANPKPSSCLGNPSYTRSLQVAVSPCWESDPPGVVSANLSSRAWTPTPAALVVLSPVSSHCGKKPSHKTKAFPTLALGRRDRFRDHGRYPYSNFRIVSCQTSLTPPNFSASSVFKQLRAGTRGKMAKVEHSVSAAFFLLHQIARPGHLLRGAVGDDQITIVLMFIPCPPPRSVPGCAGNGARPGRR